MTSRWHPAMSISHLDDILRVAKSSGWLGNQISYLIQMIMQHRKSSGWHPALVITQPDEIRPGAISSRWHMVQLTLCHPDDLGKLCVSSGWHSTLTIIHLDDSAVGSISSGWIMGIAGCHPEEITMLIPKSSGWLSYWQYLTRMTYGHCRMSSGWLTILSYLIRMT